MKDYRLSEIKEICEKTMAEKDEPCLECEIYHKNCSELFGKGFPCNWEIEIDKKVGEE